MERYLGRFRKWVHSLIQESCRWQDCVYLPNITLQIVIIWIVKGFLCQLILCYFFYQSALSVFLLFPITVILVIYQWKNWQKNILLDIESGFREWLYYIKSGLCAGKSVEQAMISCQNEFLAQIGASHPIRPGIEQFYRNLFLHIPVETCMQNFGRETGVAVLEDFAAVFEIVQKQGGRMSSTLEKSILQISAGIELRQEIQAMIAAKQLEQRIMCTMPFAILFFVGKSSGGYFESLYHNTKGICIMTVCMFIYIAGVLWGQRLTDVKI